MSFRRRPKEHTRNTLGVELWSLPNLACPVYREGGRERERERERERARESESESESEGGSDSEMERGREGESETEREEGVNVYVPACVFPSLRRI